jgi:hypothetical protein
VLGTLAGSCLLVPSVVFVRCGARVHYNKGVRWCLAPLVVVAFACGRVGFRDGVASDASSNDSTTDALGSTIDASARMFADDFEGQLAPWTALGTVTIDSGPPAPIVGTTMLRAQASSSMSSRAQVVLPAAASAGTFFVRAYYYVPSGFVIADLSILEIEQAAAGLVLVNSPTMGLYSSIKMSDGVPGTFSLPRDTWICVEVRVSIANAPGGTWDVWIDGVLRQTATGLDTFAGGIDGLFVGITWAGSTQQPSTVYVDAVVADVAPIGCL